MKEKHFLDTSVLRPILTSHPKVKKYYKQTLQGDLYICNYVKMEFLRGIIKSAIEFYFLLAMPQYQNFSEALSIWTHKFQIREHKNIEIMIANLLSAKNCLDDKNKSLRAISDYIRRLIGKLDYGFKNPGNDGTYCVKGQIMWDYNPADQKIYFQKILENLKDNELHKKCKINHYLKYKHKSQLNDILKNGSNTDQFENPESFKKIVKEIKLLDEKMITCASCAKLGDLVISLLSNSDWTLEHTDYSFNFFCIILKKTHRIHPSDISIMAKE